MQLPLKTHECTMCLGAAASNTSVEHVPTFAGHGEDDPDDIDARHRRLIPKIRVDS